jgi:hypothetical protein
MNQVAPLFSVALCIYGVSLELANYSTMKLVQRLAHVGKHNLSVHTNSQPRRRAGKP